METKLEDGGAVLLAVANARWVHIGRKSKGTTLSAIGSRLPKIYL